MDAISLLKDDHKAVARLFRRFEGAGESAFVEKREIVDRIIEALSQHAAIEEQLFYPVARATVPGTEDVALESLEEHGIVKWLLSELETMAPEHERFDAKVTVLIENVRHHVEEEENEFFPKVRAELGRSALSDLGDSMALAKKAAPTHPHPRSPDTPPGNLVAGSAAGVADRIGDTVSGLAQGGVTALGDVIATVLRRKKPQVSPTGSKLARRTATRVRGDAEDVTEAAIDAAKRAKRVTTQTASAAKRGADTTARTGRQAAKGTATAAKRGATTTGRTGRQAAKGTATAAKRGATTTGRTGRQAAKRTATAAKRAASTSTKRTARSR